MTPPASLSSKIEQMIAVPCTHVLVSLTLREDVDLGMAIEQMREEMIATAHLYLNGSIQQRFSQVDSRGVVLVFSTTNVEETRSLMAGLPFVRAELVDLQFTRLGPLLPIRTLLAAQPLA